MNKFLNQLIRNLQFLDQGMREQYVIKLESIFIENKIDFAIMNLALDNLYSLE